MQKRIRETIYTSEREIFGTEKKENNRENFESPE